MAVPRVFISSTAYDLGPVRERLRQFVLDMGHEPVMSEYSDVLYDHRFHTHTACVQEVPLCDIMVLVVGGRFGGAAVPEARDEITTPGGGTSLEHFDNLSITQIEVLKAIDEGIPLFAFVDDAVWHDHKLFEVNGGSVDIIYPSIQKADTARYIFDFINFLRRRTAGNAIVPFRQIADIEHHLRRQWSALLQRLLTESTNKAHVEERDRAIGEQIEDLKLAVLSTISADDARKIARSVLRFRSLVDFLLSLEIAESRSLLEGNPATWETVKSKAGVVEVTAVRDGSQAAVRTLLTLEDGSGRITRFSFQKYQELESLWSEFIALDQEARFAVFDALVDDRGGRVLRQTAHIQDAGDYLDSLGLGSRATASD